MKILLVYPEYPVTFWSFKYALKFVSKKAMAPPLGLLTVAGLLPKEFTKKLVDMNVSSLDDQDIWIGVKSLLLTLRCHQDRPLDRAIKPSCNEINHWIKERIG